MRKWPCAGMILPVPVQRALYAAAVSLRASSVQLASSVTASVDGLYSSTNSSDPPARPGERTWEISRLDDEPASTPGRAASAGGGGGGRPSGPSGSSILASAAYNVGPQADSMMQALTPSQSRVRRIAALIAGSRA